MILRVATSIVLVLLLVGVGAAFLALRAGTTNVAASDLIGATIGQPVSRDPRPVHFVVEPGESASTIAGRLASAGLVRSALSFRLFVRFKGVGGHLVAGDYELRPNMGLEEVVAQLTQGRMSGGFLIVPEGWRALEIADALDRAHVTSRGDFLRVVQAREIPSFPAAAEMPTSGSLEGFLFPDSYRFEPNTPADVVASRMVDDFNRHVTPDLVAAFQANGLSLQQGVTLASIIEREAVVPGERPVIASVFLNRLQRGMRLQADPTVQYALVASDASGQALDLVAGYWKRALTFADLRVESPYNTYQVAGLPPGPICSPGLASLRAVAQPASSDYLYFVSRGDGTHEFARTLDEQQRNVAKYQS